MVDYEIIGQNIRMIRRHAGLTQENLAEMIDKCPSFLGHIERGSRICSLDTLWRISNALNVSINDLMSENCFVVMPYPPNLSINLKALSEAILRTMLDEIAKWDR